MYNLYIHLENYIHLNIKKYYALEYSLKFFRKSLIQFLCFNIFFNPTVEKHLRLQSLKTTFCFKYFNLLLQEF